MHSRTLNPFIALVMLASLAAGIVVPVQDNRALAQDDAATPPLIQPVEEIEPEAEQPVGDESDGSLEIAVSADVGDGGQPPEFPREVTIGDERYLFDRLVPVAIDGLAPIAADENVSVYAMTGEGPFDSLYVTAAGEGVGSTARYLPERIQAPDVACLAEVAEVGQLTAGDSIYVFAGIETDLTVDSLQSVGTSGENQLYADPGAAQPYPELLIADPAGLLRFLLAIADGRPTPLAESLAFNGARLEFVADVSEQVDVSTLSKVGCAGPFPVFGSGDDSVDEAGSRYVRAGGRLFQFGGESAPTDVPIVIPTEIPATEAPTAAPTEEPATEAPTEAPATEAPTEEPATEEPVTEAPTEASTEEPATEAPATEAPTELPATEEPATESPATEAPQTEAPAEEPATEAPAEEATEPAAEGIATEDVEAAEEAGLPSQVEVQNITYVFTQVVVDIDIQTLVEVEVINVQNIELTIYIDQDVEGDPPRYYAATADGQVVGLYVPSSVQQTPPPTAQLQPPAFVPTQDPDAPPPPAVTAEASTTCTGDPGEINAQGLPSRMPNRIQLGGIAYGFVGTEDPDSVAELTLVGCVGAFEVLSIEGVDRAEVLILRYSGSGPAGEVVYRFEVAVTYGVEFEITGRPQVISAGDQDYRLVNTWQRSLYSSTTVILFVEDPENQAPEIFYAVNIINSPRGDAVGEYQVVGENDKTSEEMVAAGAQAGLNPDLTVEGQRYLLVSVYLPAGTTTNGFVTLFATAVDGETTVLFGRDIRRLELLIYEVIPAEQGE
ncbi:MAG: hypothetical protein ACR2GI_01155 [Thermomicrobiales bacterium]